MITLIIYILGAVLMVAYGQESKQSDGKVFDAIVGVLWPLVIGGALAMWAYNKLREKVQP